MVNKKQEPKLNKTIQKLIDDLEDAAYTYGTEAQFTESADMTSMNKTKAAKAALEKRLLQMQQDMKKGRVAIDVLENLGLKF